jgi:transposase
MPATPSKPARTHGQIRPAKSLPILQPHAAGIDLGNAEHYVCVPEDSVAPGQKPVRSFGVFNPQLDQMVDWLKQCRVQTVALESTGVMWIPVFQKLEASGIKVILVNTKGLKHVPGRKSDVLDCQWLQQLHSYGLLSGSFRPADIICQMRTLVRHRENLCSGAGREAQHMQKAMQQMGVHLHVVLSDVCGDTGLRIIDAILAGQRDPKQLLELRDERVRRSTPQEMEAALQGDWREELLIVLGQSRRAYEFFQTQISELDQKIIALLQKIPEAPLMLEPPKPQPPQAPGAGEPGHPSPGLKKKRKSLGRGGNPLPVDIGPQLAKIMGVDLTLIPGLNTLGVLIILSEIGADLKRWHSAGAFAAWLGLAPGSKISGGRVISSRTPHVMNRVSILLRLAALAVGRTDTWLGSFYKRIKVRHGAPKAMTATARKLAELIYVVMTSGKEYREVDTRKYDERVLHQKVARLCREAGKLGFELVRLKQADPDAKTTQAA